MGIDVEMKRRTNQVEVYEGHHDTVLIKVALRDSSARGLIAEGCSVKVYAYEVSEAFWRDEISCRGLERVPPGWAFYHLIACLDPVIRDRIFQRLRSVGLDWVKGVLYDQCGADPSGE